MANLIRPWRISDFLAVRRILLESWFAAYSSFIPVEDLKAYFEATYQIDSLMRLYDNPMVHGFIGEVDRQAVGYARTQFQRNEERFYLASLYLLPGFQGRGIGGELLRAVEEKALSYGLRELWVGVMLQNEAARHWYDRRGFRFVKEGPFRMGGATVPHLIGFKDLRGLSRKAPETDRSRRIAAYAGAAGEPPLADLASGMLEQQKRAWPGLAGGYAALEAARVREIRGEGWRVKVQFNPRRIVSSGARLDAESIRNRPCFLCGGHLPPEQTAILYRDDYLVLCNPAPIFPGHLTIVHRCHLAQSLPDNLAIFLQLAADFGPHRIVFYNGPGCGASAPDHLHFQAAPAGLMPVEKEILAPGNRVEVGPRGGALLWRTVGLGRGIVGIEGKAAAEVAEAAGAVIGALRRFTSSDGEPLMNLLCTYTGSSWRLICFPRRKHRPDAYFREGEGQLLISPGAADMGGVFITPLEKDFLSLDAALVRGIFREVAFDDASVEGLLESL